MQLVINIPEELYEASIRGLETGEVWDLRVAIKNGTPLPKGHGDLIDKREFKRWIETQDGDKLMTEYYLDALDMQETVVGGLYDGDID